jgi:hypothetical protein
MLKTVLGSSMYDLNTVVKKIGNKIKHQLRRTNTEIKIQKIRKPTYLLMPLFRQIMGKVSQKPLRLTHERHPTLIKIAGSLTPYTNTYKGSLKLPCKHTIRDRLAANQSLTPEDFHVHWRFERHSEPLPPLDPLMFTRDPEFLRTKGPRRGRHAAVVARSGRILSDYERVDVDIEARAAAVERRAAAAIANEGG